MSMKKIYLDKIANMEIAVSFSQLDKNTPFTHREIHMHPEYELLVNLKGEKFLELSGRICAFPENSVAIVKPYAGHRCIFQSEGMHSHFWLLVKIQDGLMESFIEEDEDGSIIQPEEQDFEQLTKVLHMLSSQSKKSDFEQYAGVFTMLDILKKGRMVELL